MSPDPEISDEEFEEIALAIARERMRHFGYLDEEIATAERDKEHTEECEPTPEGWVCLDEDGERTIHPLHDEMDAVSEQVVFTMERLLAALGSRLLPRGGSSETKYQITGAIQGKRWVWMAYVRTIGEAFESALNARQDGWSDFRAEQRTITRFPDGSELVGPWLNVEEGTP
jgi:hypothetical protein